MAELGEGGEEILEDLAQGGEKVAAGLLQEKDLLRAQVGTGVQVGDGVAQGMGGPPPSPTTTPTRTSPRQGTATRRPKASSPSWPRGGR